MFQAIEGSTILVVDDTPSNLALIYEYLGSYDARVLAAQNGIDGLRLAEAEQPDVILLDVRLPDIDGYEVCRRLHAKRETEGIPVIFLSALGETADKIEGFQAGGVDYVTKPVHREELFARLAAHITLRRQQNRLIRFFSIIGHDLRGPCAGIVGITKALQDDSATFSPEEYHEVIFELHASASNALRLTENLLQWAFLQQNRDEVRPVRVDVDASIKAAVGLLTPSAERKQIAISSWVDGERYVRFDQDMFDAILRNLISNAIKFTESGGSVAVTVGASDPEGRLSSIPQRAERWCRVAVTDTGIGMTLAQRESLFSPDRVDRRKGTDGEPGTGLGLVLCREMALRNGAELTVESAVGEGSTFVLVAPVHGSADRAADREP